MNRDKVDEVMGDCIGREFEAKLKDGSIVTGVGVNYESGFDNEDDDDFAEESCLFYDGEEGSGIIYEEMIEEIRVV